MVEAEELRRWGGSVGHFDGERREGGVRLRMVVGIGYERGIGETVYFDSHEGERGPAGESPGAMKRGKLGK